MVIDFSLVTSEKKYVFFVKLLSLVAVLVAQAYELIGNYLPIELWQIIIVYLVADLLLSLVRFFTVTAYRKRSLLPVGQRDNFVLGVDSLKALLVFLVTAGSTFAIFDIAFQTFFASISVVAVALVLIFRDYITNYLASFRLMFTADYRIGDYIKVGESTKGIITDITFRATKLRTDEGDVLFVPNTKLMTSEVVNYSKTKLKRITVPFTLPTAAVDSVDDFEQQIKQALVQQFPEVIIENKLFLRIVGIDNWQTQFSFEASVDQYNFSIEEKVTKAVYQVVLSVHTSTEPPNIIATQTLSD